MGDDMCCNLMVGLRPGADIAMVIASRLIRAEAVEDAERQSFGRENTMATRTSDKTIESADGRKRLTIFRRDDGLYEYQGERIEQEDFSGDGYWVSCDFSGLFGSAFEAEEAATHEVVWLKEQARPR